MVFSIKRRMLVLVTALLIPLCLFAYFLMQVGQGNIDFATKEEQGLQVQAPLTKILSAISQNKIDNNLTANVEDFEKTYNKYAENVGLTGDWATRTADYIGNLKNIANKSPSELSNISAETKAIIVRVSDGSNLTLDPDLDSYWVMDAISFAIPNNIHNLAALEANMLELSNEKEISKSEYAQLVKLTHISMEDDLGRIIGSLSTALAEDKNFYGASPSFSRLNALMEDYKQKNAVLSKQIDDILDGKQVSESAIKANFELVNQSLMALWLASHEEMKVLLSIRKNVLDSDMDSLLFQGLLAVVVGLVLFYFISNSVTKPLNKLNTVMKDLASGKNAVVPYLSYKDEIGQMARAVLVFKDNAQKLQDIGKEFESSLKQSVEIVASASTELSATSSGLQDRATKSQDKVVALTDNLGVISVSMKTVATAGEQLYASINEISTQVHKSSESTRYAVKEAENVSNVTEELSQTAQKVDGIIKIINGIASKITLLALNATIEAARAGEAGKGFAVVADEVRTLATQTSTATTEIASLINAIQSSAGDTLGAVRHITEIISELNQISGAIAAAVEEQGAATKDISGHIKSASSKMQGVTHNVKEVADSAAISAAAASQAQQSSYELSIQAEKLKNELDKFMKNIILENA